MNLSKNAILCPSVSVVYISYFFCLGAKKCSLVRQLMSEDRFTLNLELLEKQLSLKEFMLYCYKTSFCPINNSQIHDWSQCNYAHRQQDFRRPPYLFYYEPEPCPNISDDGSWENCENYLDCPYSHTLVETLFNPLNYKLNDCYHKTSAEKFRCSQLGDLCCHAHSNEERKNAIDVLEGPIPKQFAKYAEFMQYYLEELPNYLQKRPAKEDKKLSSGKKRKSKGENLDSDSSDSNDLSS